MPALTLAGYVDLVAQLHLVPLYCANRDCREAQRGGRQIVAEGEPGHVVRGKCSKCRKYTTGRV